MKRAATGALYCVGQERSPSPFVRTTMSELSRLPTHLTSLPQRCLALALAVFKDIAVGDESIQAAHEAKFRCGRL